MNSFLSHLLKVARRLLLSATTLSIPYIAFAQSDQFRVQSITVDENGELAIEFPSTDGSYYLLKRGDTVDITDQGVDGEIGVDGIGVLRDVEIDGRTQSFYIIEKISADEPLDMDEDGMDDVFEIQFKAFLDPFDPSDADLDFDDDGNSNLKEYQDGTDPSLPPLASPKIVEVAPFNGEAMVNVTRNAVVRFDREMDPTTIDETSFQVHLNQVPVEGTVEVSSTGLFATFFPEDPLPASTQFQVVVDGDRVKDAEGIQLDGDDDGNAGGVSRTSFRTLPLNRITGTNVFGFVKDSLTGDPLEGVTIFVNAFPEASGTTDAEGRFELIDMPSPEFFVHIVGETAINVPEGFRYPNLGKPVDSVPGQSVQLNKGGETFDIYLPLMQLEDVQELSDSEVTEVGLGPGGKETLENLFPEVDSTVWDRVCVDIAPNSARDDIGNTLTQAAIIPVPPDRIPEPLPEELPMPVVISVQVFNATRFDVPAPVTFPNLPDPTTGDTLTPGAKSGLWSYDHDAGRWILQGPMTVSEDGLFLVSDPGVGIRAPGWHGPNNGNSGEGGGGNDGDCDTAQQKMLSASAQCILGTALSFVELAPGIGCAVSLAAAAGGAAVDCDIDPEGCSTTMAKAAMAGLAGCIPGAGLAVTGITCADGFTGALDALNNCKSGSSSSFPLNQADFSLFNLDQQTPEMLLEDQFELVNRSRTLFETVAGDPAWWSVPVAELGTLSTFLSAFDATLESASNGGVTISATEAADLLAAARPSNLTDEHVNNLIARFNRFASGGITDQEQSEIEAAAKDLQDWAEFLDASGWESTVEGFTRGLAELSSEAGAQISAVRQKPLYYRLTNMESGFERRGQLGDQGQFSNFILTSDTFYLVEYVDPDTLEIGSAVFESAGAGNILTIPPALMAASTDIDSDSDGLPNDVEDIVGTFSDNPDSDDDGVSDAVEIQQGQNPLSGISLPIGVLANIEMDDWSNGIDLDDTHAYVTAGEAGLAIIDIRDPLLPIQESLIDLTGYSNQVAVSEQAGVAAVSISPDDLFRDPRSLQFIDVSNPAQPVHLKTIELQARDILEYEGVFYVTVGFPQALNILLFEASSLNQIGGFTTGSQVQNIEIYKDKLFAAAGNDLEIYDLSDPTFPLLSDTDLDGLSSIVSGWPLLAEDDVLYVGSDSAYQTFDISDPSNPTLISDSDGSGIDVVDLASNGSGLMIIPTGNGTSATLDLYDASDVNNVDQRLEILFDNSRIEKVLLKDGLAYFAEGREGFTIFNYLDLDRDGTPPTVTLDLSDLDVDENKAGIQVVEGSRVFVEPDVQDDVQINRTEWLLDGQVMETNVNGHVVFTVYLPLINDVGSTIDLQARATDTGGNQGVSDVVSLELVPGLSAPELFLSAPQSGEAGYTPDSIVLWFQEAIDPNSVNLAEISLTTQSEGTLPNLIAFSMTNPRMLVLWLESALPAGDFELLVGTNALTGIGGTALTTPLSINFTSYDQDPTTAIWISDLDGNFSNPANWIFGLIPALDQNVIIDRPLADPVVTLDWGTRIGSLTITEPFIVDRGLGFFQVLNEWNSSATGQLISGTLDLQGNAVFTGPVSFDTGAVQIAKTAEFQSDFTVLSGEIIMNGEESDLQITGTITAGDLSLECRSGATLEIPWLTSMGETTQPDLRLEAQGSGSQLSLPNLESLTPPVPGGLFGNQRMTILARSGGTINLPNLTTINAGRILIEVKDTNSVINIPEISSLTGPNESSHSLVAVTRSGTLNAGPINTLDFTNLDLDETVQFPITAITSMTNSTLEIDGFTPDLSNLATIDNIGLRALSGAVIELPSFTSLTMGRDDLYADGENSVLRLPDLVTLTGSQVSSGQTNLRALRGGRIELPSLTTMDGYFNIRSSNENTVIDLPALTQLTSLENRFSRINNDNEGVLQLTSPTLDGVDFDLTETGVINGTTITATEKSKIRDPGTLSFNLTNQGLIELDDERGPLIIEGNLILDTTSLIQVDIGRGSENNQAQKLEITGAATLGGTLEVDTPFNYEPQVGDEFEIMTFTSKTGNFTTLEGLDLEDGLAAQVEVNDTNVVIKVVAAP